MGIVFILQNDAAMREENEKLRAKIKARSRIKERREMEVRRLRTPADAAKRADELQAENQPRRLMRLIEDLKYGKPHIYQGILPRHAGWIADTFAKEGQNTNLVNFVRDVVDDARLLAGVSPARIGVAIGKMSPGAAARALYLISKNPAICAAIPPDYVEASARLQAPAAQVNNFITLVKAAENFPAWKPLVEKGAKAFRLDYAFRAAEETGAGNAILVTQRLDAPAKLSVLHPHGYKFYWWNMKPQKPLNLLVRPLEGRKLPAEIQELRQGVVSKFRSALEELADRHPANPRLSNQLTKLDARIAKLGLKAG